MNMFNIFCIVVFLAVLLAVLCLLVIGIRLLINRLKELLRKKTDEEKQEREMERQRKRDLRGPRYTWILKFVYKAVLAILFPLNWMKDKISEGLHYKLKQKRRRTEKWDIEIHESNRYFKDEPEHRKIGLYNIIFVLFCIVFSVAVVFWAISSGKVEAGLVEGSFLESLPIFAIINMIINGAITYEGLLQIALFNVLSLFLMSKNQFEGKSLFTIFFDLVFTVFCASLLYLIPESVYAMPIKLVSRLISVMGADSGNVFLTVLKIIGVGLVLIIILYLAVAVCAIAVKEIIASIVYSAIPLIGVLVMIVFFTNKDWDPVVINSCCYVVTIAATVFVSYRRLDNDALIYREIEMEK